MKAIVSCAGKFHAFALAEQLQKRQMLAGLYTTYAWQKNRLMRRFAGRVDRENIDPKLIRTNIPLAILLKTSRRYFACNELYDRWVAQSIARRRDYDVFIGWSGMSLRAIQAAKRQGKVAIVTRGSSHILYQNAILKEEYLKFGLDFSIDERVIEKEMAEYEASDFVVVPSSFARQSFIEQGISADKVIANPTGASRFFSKRQTTAEKKKFRILYLGSLTVQKGLVYLFEALNKLTIPSEQYEAWFIGKASDELAGVIAQHRKPNWHFLGHIQHYKLPEYLSQCDVGVQPSLQEGLSAVIPQMLGCGIPVIASANTGGMDIIRDGETGYVVPIRSPEAIAEKIMQLYQNPAQLDKMKSNAAAASAQNGFTWDDYGERYSAFLNTLR
jgi:glycosyltransferase involved in cell wall biosynthesis